MKTSIKIMITIAVIVLLVISMFFMTNTSSTYADVKVEKPYLVKTITSSKQLILSWNRTFANVDGKPKRASGYQLQYSTDSSFKNAKTLSYGEEHYRKTYNLPKKASLYYARIRAIYKNGKSTVYSGWRTAKSTVLLSKYTYPEIMLREAGNDITISWDKVSGATYYIYRYDNKVWTQIKKITDSNTSEYTDKNKFYDRSYKYLVKTKQSVNTNNPPVINASPQITETGSARSIKIKNPLTAPAGIRSEYTEKGISLSWDPVEKADKYICKYSDDKTLKSYSIRETKTPNIELTDIPEGDDVYITVTSFLSLTIGEETKTYQSVPSGIIDVKKPPYTIKFNGSSQTSGATGAMTVKEGETVKLKANKYAKKGYTFIGWSREKNGAVDLENYQIGTPEFKDQEEIKDLTGIGKTITLYACWKGTGPEAAADWALRIAKDDTFDYGLVSTSGKLSRTDGHSHCWFCKGGLKVYCCNSLCTAAYQHGMPYFSKFCAGSTGPDWWAKQGFKRMGKNYAPSKIKKGDLICGYNEERYSHIMMASSDDSVPLEERKIVNARGWDKGICTQNMLKKLDNYRHYYVLRLE